MKKPTELFTHTLETPKFTNPNPRKQSRSSHHLIYPLQQVGELIKIIRSQEPPQKTVRYLVDCSFRLWFAEEGAPTNTIPAHFQMTGESAGAARCIAAGNMEFSDDFTKIGMLNNKSGDFRPTFDSIKWPLAIMIIHELYGAMHPILLADELRLEELTPSGGSKDVHVVNKAELISWVIETFAEKIEQLQAQPTDIKEVTYQSSKAFHHYSGNRVRLFAEEEDNPSEAGLHDHRLSKVLRF